MIFVRREIDSLARCGFVVDTFVLRSRTSPRIILVDAVNLLGRIRTFCPSVVHVQYGTMTSFFCALLVRTPLVITFRGSDLNPAPSMNLIHSALGRFMSQLSVLRARRIICVSEPLKRRLWWRASLCAVIPGGVDLDEFQPRPREESRILLSWPMNPPILLFNAGKEPAVKRLDLAEAAYRRARSACPNLLLKVLDGTVDPGRIELALNAANCLLVTSDWEGSPTIVKEALACDLPVVSVDVGDVTERLAGVENSRVVARSAVALGDAIAEVVASGNKSGGRQAAKSVEIMAIAERIGRVYDEAIADAAVVE